MYHKGCAVKVSTTMKDTMEAEQWAPELRVCCEPPDVLPSNTRLHRLVVALVDVQVNAPLPLGCGTTASTCPWTISRVRGCKRPPSFGCSVDCNRSSCGGQIQISRGVCGTQVPGAPIQGALVLLAPHGG